MTSGLLSPSITTSNMVDSQPLFYSSNLPRFLRHSWKKASEKNAEPLIRKHLRVQVDDNDDDYNDDETWLKRLRGNQQHISFFLRRNESKRISCDFYKGL